MGFPTTIDGTLTLPTVHSVPPEDVASLLGEGLRRIHSGKIEVSQNGCRLQLFIRGRNPLNVGLNEFVFASLRKGTLEVLPGQPTLLRYSFPIRDTNLTTSILSAVGSVGLLAVLGPSLRTLGFVVLLLGTCAAQYLFGYTLTYSSLGSDVGRLVAQALSQG